MPRKDEETFACPVCRMFSRAKDSVTFQHLKNARREMLLALKSVIEEGIERLDAEEKPTSKARKVKVN